LAIAAFWSVSMQCSHSTEGTVKLYITWFALTPQEASCAAFEGLPLQWDPAEADLAPSVEQLDPPAQDVAAMQSARSVSAPIFAKFFMLSLL
jgi:hypothetical protein